MSCVKKDSRANRVSIETDDRIYHEKQVREMCALHALNNLFQDENAFTKQLMDSLCHKLSPDSYVNPHKSMLGLGNYDVNVIMAAVQQKDCEAIWFDKRRDIGCLEFQHIDGFILNVPTDYKIGFLRLPIRRKHWICIREMNEIYYNLDSKLDAPEIIGRVEEMKNYLREQLESKEKELLLIVSKKVEKSGLWRVNLQNGNQNVVGDDVQRKQYMNGEIHSGVARLATPDPDSCYSCDSDVMHVSPAYEEAGNCDVTSAQWHCDEDNNRA